VLKKGRNSLGNLKGLKQKIINSDKSLLYNLNQETKEKGAYSFYKYLL
jgi:hypothetical protein